MSLFDWFRGERHVEPAPQVADEENAAFSTHERRLPGAAARAWENLTSRIVAALPRFVDSSGTAMDGMEDSQGANSLKSAYSLSQPNISDVLLLWYVSQSFIGHQMCAILSQHWLIDKACGMPAADAIRQGYDIVSANDEELSPDILKTVERFDEAFGLNRHLKQFIHKGRIFGIRIAFFKVDSNDPNYYEKPFNIDGILPGAYRGIVQVDPYWTAPVLDEEAAAQPDTLHFYEPTWWIINGKRHHRTHLVIFRTGELPDFLKPGYIYSGVPVPQKIMERVYAAERTANEGPLLAMTKRTTGFGTNTAKAFANKDQFDQRMAEWLEFRDNNAVKIYDKANDELVQLDTSLADLDDTIMNQYQLVAAGSDVPATKLLGTTPKGFNATGEQETKSYHEFLESVQFDMTPLAARHHQLIAKSYILPKFNVQIELRAAWRPVDSPDAGEEATIKLQNAQADDLWVGMGAIDGVDVNERLRMDRQSGYTGIAPGLRQAEPTEANAKIFKDFVENNNPSAPEQ